MCYGKRRVLTSTPVDPTAGNMENGYPMKKLPVLFLRLYKTNYLQNPLWVLCFSPLEDCPIADHCLATAHLTLENERFYSSEIVLCCLASPVSDLGEQ